MPEIECSSPEAATCCRKTHPFGVVVRYSHRVKSAMLEMEGRFQLWHRLDVLSKPHVVGFFSVDDYITLKEMKCSPTGCTVYRFASSLRPTNPISPGAGFRNRLVHVAWMSNEAN